jgi:hypothetical protein
MRRDDKQLALAIEAPMRVVHAFGADDQIFAKWGLSDSKVGPAIFEWLRLGAAKPSPALACVGPRRGAQNDTQLSTPRRRVAGTGN